MKPANSEVSAGATAARLESQDQAQIMTDATGTQRPSRGAGGKVTSVLIVDDYPLLRHGLNTLLSAQPDIEVVAEVGAAEDILPTVAKCLPDVILLDLNLPEAGSLDILEQIREKHPESMVIVTASPDDGSYLSDAVKKGAAGYLLKTANVPTILAAVRTVAQGGTWLQRELTGKLFDELSRLSQARSESADPGLTGRESEVLTLIAQGLKNREIADRLYISPRTVKVHISNLFRKLSLRDRVQATRYAIRRRMVVL